MVEKSNRECVGVVVAVIGNFKVLQVEIIGLLLGGLGGGVVVELLEDLLIFSGVRWLE